MFIIISEYVVYFEIFIYLKFFFTKSDYESSIQHNSLNDQSDRAFVIEKRFINIWCKLFIYLLNNYWPFLKSNWHDYRIELQTNSGKQRMQSVQGIHNHKHTKQKKGKKRRAKSWTITEQIMTSPGFLGSWILWSICKHQIL